MPNGPRAIPARCERVVRPALAVCLVACFVAGCASDPVPRTTAPTEPQTRAPRYSEAHAGLEMRVWLAEDDLELTIALAELVATRPISADAGPLDPQSIDAWRRGGIRVFAVDEVDLRGLRERVVRGGATQSRWVGQPASDVRLIQGPDHPGTPAVRTPSGVVALDAGSVDLTGRAWIMPEPNPDPAPARLAVELRLVAQETRTRSPFADPSAQPDATGTRATRTLARLSALLAPGQTLVVLPADPDAEWSGSPNERTAPSPGTRSPAPIRVPSATPVQGPAGETPSDEGDLTGTDPAGTAADESAPRRQPADAPTRPAAGTPAITTAGPAEPAVPTLGDLLMPRLPGRTRAQQRRVVLVLVPRVPSEVSLLRPAPPVRSGD